MISDLVDYLTNNLPNAHYCRFDILKSLPYYRTFDHFLINFDNSVLSALISSQVLSLAYKGYDVKNIFNQVKSFTTGNVSSL